jgi:predicted nucleotidyltransferase component of viral defense system
MNKDQLDLLVKQLNISQDQILREEAEMVFLDALANHKIGTKVIFYGGTAMRLAYNSPRFSEDLDFIKIKPIEFSEFRQMINGIVDNNSNWKLSDIKDKRQTLFAVIVIKDEKLKHNFSIRIEIHKPSKKVDFKNELKLIKSPTSILDPLILVPDLKVLKDLKIAALKNRKKARDIFDLWYLAQVLKEKFELPQSLPKYSKREFKNELQVFLPSKYYSVIDELYEKIN